MLRGGETTDVCGMPIEMAHYYGAPIHFQLLWSSHTFPLSLETESHVRVTLPQKESHKPNSRILSICVQEGRGFFPGEPNARERLTFLPKKS